MKHKILLLLSTVLVGIISVFVSCSKREATTNPESESKMEIPSLVYGEGARIGTFKLPDETYIQLIEGGFEFTFPEGFQLAYIDEADGLVITDGSIYKCTCSANGGCTVFWQKNEGFGCLQSTCTGSCTGEWVHEEIVTTGVVINHNQPFKFIESGDDFNSYFSFKPTLLEIPYVMETLKRINLKYYGKEILTEEDLNKEDYSIVPVSLFGNLVAYALPDKYNTRKGGPTVSCNCTGTGGGQGGEDPDCDKVVPHINGLWTCPNITCSICQMTVIQQK